MLGEYEQYKCRIPIIYCSPRASEKCLRIKWTIAIISISYRRLRLRKFREDKNQEIVCRSLTALIKDVLMTHCRLNDYAQNFFTLLLLKLSLC